MTQITQIKKRTLLATAAAAKLCTSSFQSNAGIIYNDIVDKSTNSINFQLDIDGGGHDLGFESNLSVSLLSNTLEGTAFINAFPGVNIGLVDVGDSINGGFSSTNIELAKAIKISSNNQGTSGPFSAGGSGYLGFTLGSGNNGWLGFDVAPLVARDTSSYAITVKDYAYEDSSLAIEAGAKISAVADPQDPAAPATNVPEPATWTLFALGAYVVSRRKIKAA
tara:strand:- start:3497 stop:4162 length:666 start_codon:yes stop_codon:yes gene_type:complete